MAFFSVVTALGAENAIRYVAETEPMPLSALVFYIESKYKYELLHDSYLFEALHAILIKTPDSYYPEYPRWHEFTKEVKPNKNSKAKRRTGDEIIDDIIAKLS